jgi:hypothetical protein
MSSGPWFFVADFGTSTVRVENVSVTCVGS